MNSVKRIAGLKCTGQDRASVGQQHLFDYSFARFALLKSSCIRLQVGSTLLVCSLVLTTSRGFVIMPAMAPEKPAQIKYHKRGVLAVPRSNPSFHVLVYGDHTRSEWNVHQHSYRVTLVQSPETLRFHDVPHALPRSEPRTDLQSLLYH